MVVVHEVERIYRALLWHGSNVCTIGGLVSWDNVCKSNSSGGLGVKPIHVWYHAALIRHIWDLV